MQVFAKNGGRRRVAGYDQRPCLSPGTKWVKSNLNPHHRVHILLYSKRAILFLSSSKILTPHPPLRPASLSSPRKKGGGYHPQPSRPSPHSDNDIFPFFISSSYSGSLDTSLWCVCNVLLCMVWEHGCFRIGSDAVMISISLRRWASLRFKRCCPGNVFCCTEQDCTTFSSFVYRVYRVCTLWNAFCGDITGTATKHSITQSLHHKT